MRAALSPRVRPPVSTVRLSTVLVLTMMVASFLNSATSVLAPFITADLNLSRSRFGAVVTAMYAVATVGSAFVGGVVDRFGVTRALPLLYLIQVGAVVVVASSSTQLALVVGLALAGLPMAASNPVTNRLVATQVAPDQQGVVLGVKQSGGQVMWLVAGILVAPAAGVFGWRWAALIGVLIGGVALVAQHGVVRRVARTQAGDDAVAPAFERRQYLPFATYAFLMTLSSASAHVYLPLYGHERVGLGVGSAGAVVALLGVPGICARIAWGRAAARIRSTDAVLAFLAAGTLIGIGLFAAAEPLGPVALALGALVFGATSGAWPAVAMLGIIRESPPGRVGSASGVMLVGGHAALVVSPLAFGSLIDANSGSYHVAWLANGVAVVAAGVVAVRRLRTK